MLRSNLAVPVWDTVPPDVVSSWVLPKANITWKIGALASRRCGAACRTISSKGTDWWSWAALTTSRTVSSSAPNVVSGSIGTRSGSEFTNRPTTPSTSTRMRPATGVPITRSTWPDHRCNTVANPAR